MHSNLLVILTITAISIAFLAGCSVVSAPMEKGKTGDSFRSEIEHKQGSVKPDIAVAPKRKSDTGDSLMLKNERLWGAMALCGMGLADSNKGFRTRLEKEILSSNDMTSESKIKGYKDYAECIQKISSEEGIFPEE